MQPNNNLNQPNIPAPQPASDAQQPAGPSQQGSANPTSPNTKPPQPYVTQQDVRSVVQPGTGLINPGALTPQQIQEVTQEWHNSKIVKFGGSFLIIMWFIYAIAQFKAAGLVGFVVIAGGALTSWRIYKRTKSPFAWYALVLLICITQAILFSVSHSR